MVSKPKLAYIIHGIGVGGAEMAALSALSRLSAHYDLRVHVLGKSNALLLKKIDADIRQKMVLWNLPSFLLPLYLPFVCLSLVKFRPAFVISSLWRSAIPAVIFRTVYPKTRYFIMVHNTVFFHVADRFFTTCGIRRSDTVFADSTSTKLFAAHIVKARKAVKTLSFLTTAAPKSINAYEFSRGIRFFSMCRLNVVKRVHLAVRVIAWLRKQGVDASLHIYGRPDGDEIAVKEEIEKSNMQESISLCGEVLPDEKDSLYRKYNCYIQLSEYEGMAMSTVEAMQQGMLCVVTPVGEIANYAKGNVSAMFMQVTEGEVEEKSLRNLLDVLNDKNKCEAIATAAHSTFRNTPLFADSLIDAIQSSQIQ